MPGGKLLPAMTVDVELLYRQHLSEADRRLLRSVAGETTDLVSALSHPALEAAVLGTGSLGTGSLGAGSLGVAVPASDGQLMATTPFLTFAAAVHCSAARLATATFVEERWAARQRIPVFDVAPLRDLVAAPARRLFLVELLASYTHVASGATWERTRRGWRRRRFSELDPVRLAGLLEAVTPAERPGVYRRLGDLALFLTGVFPDHPTLFDFGDAGTGRLLRLSGLGAGGGDDRSGRQLMEDLGSRWYRLAASSARRLGNPATAAMAVVEEVGERFDDARRVLNVVTDQYLFPLRERWFGGGSR